MTCTKWHAAQIRRREIDASTSRKQSPWSKRGLPNLHILRWFKCILYPNCVSKSCVWLQSRDHQSHLNKSQTWHNMTIFVLKYIYRPHRPHPSIFASAVKSSKSLGSRGSNASVASPGTCKTSLVGAILTSPSHHHFYGWQQSSLNGSCLWHWVYHIIYI